MESRDDPVLRRALQALPLESPPEPAWPELAARLQHRANPRRRLAAHGGWLALAAALLALAVLPTRHPDAELVPTMDAETAQWMARSRDLETQIRQMRSGGDAVDDLQFAWESAIQEDLALLDAGLQSAAAPSAELWRARVSLLEELKTASTTEPGALLWHARLN